MTIDNVTYLRYARRGDESVDRSAIPRRAEVESGVDEPERAAPDDLWFGPRTIESGIVIALIAGVIYAIFRFVVVRMVAGPY